MPTCPRFLPLPPALALLFLACGGGAGGTPAAPPLPPGTLRMSFATPAGQVPVIRTNLVVRAGSPLSVPFAIYTAAGAPGVAAPAAVTLENLPPGLTVSIDGVTSDRFELAATQAHALTLTGGPGLAPGTGSFRLRARTQGVECLMPVVFTYDAAPFVLQAPLAPAVTLVPGQALAFPLHLRHDDQFYQAPDGTAPAYLGDTRLASTGTLPDGLAVTFPAPQGLTGRAAASLMVAAAPTTAPGSYTVVLRATRTGSATQEADPVALTVNVADPSAPPAVWLQDVEWGQTVMAPDLHLVAGKPALLRALVLADRPGLPAPAGSVQLLDGTGALLATLPMQGPGQVPMVIPEGDLPNPMGFSGSSYTALLPAAAVRPGLRARLQIGDLPPQWLAPTVVADPGLDLTIVPVTCQGVAPDLPGDGDLAQGLLALWPLGSVRLAHRAPYATAVAPPQPDAPGSGAAWVQMLDEMAALRILDGSPANYYGFVNPGITGRFGWGITGVSRLGDGVGIGVDLAASHWFQNPDPSRALAVSVFLHEEGHAFNVSHTPVGGAADPQLAYPYSGGSIGAWGFDPFTLAAHDPAGSSDLMGYASGPLWISDWNYRSAMAFLAQRDRPAAPAPAAAEAPGADQWVVSGWLDPDGQARLLPLVRLACAPAPPAPGDVELRLATAAGSRRLAFAAVPVADLPDGWRPFCFTVPAAGELTAAEVRVPGRPAVGLARSHTLAARTLALGAPASGPVVQEAGGVLRLRWDAGLHPYVNVFHEGARRTTLALHLTGGAADLPLAGLPPGGVFLLQFSEGLDPVAYRVPRP